MLEKIGIGIDIIDINRFLKKPYSENQKIKNISDKEIIHSFKNEVIVPRWIVNNKINSLFNNFLKTISKITKNIL